MRRLVVRALGESAELGRHANQAAVKGQLTAQRMQLLEIELERLGALHQQGLAQHLGRHERIAIAVAADP